MSQSSQKSSASKSSADTTATGNSPTFVGVEHHILGLSPQYWAHTPMLIGDILSLGLINGVDCMMSTPRRGEHPEETKKRRRPSEDCANDRAPIIDHVVPLSRCEIIGFVVSRERKANSTLYLLDDGSGLIDCICWEDDGDGVYSLPPLVDTYPFRSTSNGSTFGVGDCVRIRGKIKCISVGAESRPVDIAVVGNNRGVPSNLQRYEVPIHVVREIAVATMEHVLDQKTNNGLDAETTHWLKCVRFAESIEIQCGTDAANIQGEIEQIRNGADVLNILGNDLLSKMTHTEAIDVDEEDNGAWRVFGPDCTCRLPHKDELLYCHCLASFEALDPHQIFRDALLKHLIDMMGENPTSSPFRFHYGSLMTIDHLIDIATKTVPETPNPAINVHRIFANTFKALRNDGIVYLDDQDNDIYLLISKSTALIPYLSPLIDKESSALERSMRRSNPPPFIKKVPASRLRFVTKYLLANSKKSETGKVSQEN